MDFYIARQPIFNPGKRVYAYELLYRGAADTPMDKITGDRATSSLLSSTFITEGIEKISSYKPCFINFTKTLLLKDVPHTFPNTQVVVEVLEDVPADPEVVEACRKLREKGYTIALDDFIYDPSLEPLIELAHIIKFDLVLTPLDTIERTLHRLSRFDLKFLAEKVESNDVFEQTLKRGFSYFQGYFFQKPESIRIKELNAVKLHMVQLLAELASSSWTVDRLKKIIAKDVALSYKLLRYLNSSYFSRVQEITSLSHAIAYLGQHEVRRFALLVVISELATNKPGELIRVAMMRAKFCELLAISSHKQESSSDIFVLGLFSLLDAMLDMPMANILEKLPLSPGIKDGLLDQTGPFAPYLLLAVAYEKRDKAKCLEIVENIGPFDKKIHDIYLEALEFSQSLVMQ